MVIEDLQYMSNTIELNFYLFIVTLFTDLKLKYLTRLGNGMTTS